MSNCWNCQTHSSFFLHHFQASLCNLRLTLTRMILALVLVRITTGPAPPCTVFDRPPFLISCIKALLSGLCRRGMLATPRIVTVQEFTSLKVFILSPPPLFLRVFSFPLLLLVFNHRCFSSHTPPPSLVSFGVRNIMAPLRVEKIHACHQQTWLFPEQHSLQLPVLSSLFFLLWSQSLKTFFFIELQFIMTNRKAGLFIQCSSLVFINLCQSLILFLWSLIYLVFISKLMFSVADSRSWLYDFTCRRAESCNDNGSIVLQLPGHDETLASCQFSGNIRYQEIME